MDEPPAQALRYQNSSMRVAMDLVKSGEAHACVSAGNTGALMAISRFVLKTLPGIDRRSRPCFRTCGARTPTCSTSGANVDCTAEHLLQFGIMGAMLVAAVEHKDRPTIGLLNIGVEDIKGNEAVKQAAALLRASGLNFAGNVEGNDIYKGTVDVVVCDGFVGNVALKCSEGVAEDDGRDDARGVLAQCADAARGACRGAGAARSATGSTRGYNGASLLGLRGIVVKPWLGRRLRLRPGARARGRGSAQQRAAAHRRPHGAAPARAAAMIYSRICGTGSYLPRAS